MSRRPYPFTTGLQAWHLAFGCLLTTARETLDPIEFRELLDILVTRLANEVARDLEEAA